MRDYYEHTRNIFRVTERITEQFVRDTSQARPVLCSVFFRWFRPDKTPIGDSFFVRDTQLYPARRDLFHERSPSK